VKTSWSEKYFEAQHFNLDQRRNAVDQKSFVELSSFFVSITFVYKEIFDCEKNVDSHARSNFSPWAFAP